MRHLPSMEQRLVSRGANVTVAPYGSPWRTVLLCLLVLAASGISICVGTLVFLLALIKTPDALVVVTSSLLSIVATGYLIGRLAFRVTRGNRYVRLGTAVGFWNALVVLLIFGAMHIFEDATGPSSEVDARLVDELKAHSHQVARLTLSERRDDLLPLLGAVSGKRVVALGESTHGTKEFFLLKHRVVEALVTEGGFRHFAMEVHPEHVGAPINDYLNGAPLNVKLGWPWGTQEYLELLEWMRNFNRNRPLHDRIRFYGIDPVVGERDRIMASNVLRILEEAGPNGRVMVFTANSHVHAVAGGMGQHLKSVLGNDVYLLGFDFHQGSFTSRAKSVHEYTAGPFPSSYYSYVFNELKGPARFADFAELSQSEVLKEWINSERYTNSMYEIYGISRFFPIARDNSPLKHRTRTPVAERFDGLVHINTSSPARLVER